MTTKPIKVVISPATLAQIERDYPPEEVQGVLDSINEAAELALSEDSVQLDVDNLAVEDPVLYQALIAQMKLLGYSSIDEWVTAEVEKPVLN